MPQSVSKRDGPLWLTEEDIGAAINLNQAIEALATGIRSEAEGRAANIDKALGLWAPASSMHALGSQMAGSGFVGWKTWANTPKGAAADFSLFCSQTGRLLAVMEAGLLGKYRTSGISGIATSALAQPDADDMALIGTGAQALMQVYAVAATRPIRRLRVFSPTAEKRSAFVAAARAALPFAVEEAMSVAEAVADMPIVTVITRAREPFLDAGMLARGAHINAAGAILPESAELGQDIFDRATLVVVDSIGNARKASRELRERFDSEPDGWTSVSTLGAILADEGSRPPGADLTIFKPMGMGLSDLSVAVAAYHRCIELGLGVTLPVTPLPDARWTAAQ